MQTYYKKHRIETDGINFDIYAQSRLVACGYHLKSAGLFDGVLVALAKNLIDRDFETETLSAIRNIDVRA